MLGHKSGKKFAVGALLAGIVGFVVGILSAPKSGEETREDLKRSTKVAITQIEKDLKKIHTDLQGLISSAGTEIKTSSMQVSKDFKKAIEKAKKSQVKVKTVLSTIHEGGSDDPELSVALSEAREALKHLKKYFEKNQSV